VNLDWYNRRCILRKKALGRQLAGSGGQKMKFVKDGNFSPWFRFVLWATGIGITVASYNLLSGMQMFIGVVVEMVVLATGTYAEKANLLHLKAIGNSYKKVRARVAK
jgi:hypothetical protein